MALSQELSPLRQLPGPARLVLTVFLLAVGLGYLAALVQLHLQDSRGGTLLPTVADVILKYTGKQWLETAPPPAVSQLERLIMGPIEGVPWNGTGSMAAAFFHKDGAGFKREYEQADEATKERLMAERNGEREALRLWIRLEDDAQRRAAYEADRFVPPPEAAPKIITPHYRDPDGAIKVRSILTDRCARCHAAGAEQENYPLETYDQIAKYLVVPPTPVVPPGGGWVSVATPISLEKLAQSTHAHLLSFAVLFSATGFLFALTGYPALVRYLLAPAVLLALVADVSLWWLARLSDHYGPYFAMIIPLTGGIAGTALVLQILLTTFHLYTARGKTILACLLLLAVIFGTAVYVQYVQPALQAKRIQPHAAKLVDTTSERGRNN
ncbi:MAG: hypothetical protein NZU63_12530 [Gemmataceae bacterium]|nr:hypothetical protein [Gemmataceae bacterium]MDW8244087.1 hypothetical protein [Thermogemmata sp.]